MSRSTHSDHHPLRALIAGGGVAALEAALMLRAVASDRTEVTIVSPKPHFAWRALEVNEAFGMGVPARFELQELCDDIGARFISGAVSSVRRETRDVTLGSGDELEYDALLLATGAHPVPAIASGVTFDRLNEPSSFEELLDDLDARLATRITFVVPPGAAWPLPTYELAMLAAARTARAAVTLVTSESRPLAMFGSPASDAVARALEDAGVMLVTGERPEVVSPGYVQVGGHWLSADRVVAMPALTGPRLPGVPCDGNGFTTVDGQQAVPQSDGRIFAAGDGCAGTIKQGGIAAQQAAVAAAGIAALAGIDARVESPVRPVLRAVLTTATGPLYLRADLEDVELTSEASRHPLWSPPGKVVAPRLARYIDARTPVPSVPANSTTDPSHD